MLFSKHSQTGLQRERATNVRYVNRNYTPASWDFYSAILGYAFILGRAFLGWVIHSNKPRQQERGQLMTQQTATILNRLLAKAVIVLLIASALVLSPIILAGIELLGKG